MTQKAAIAIALLKGETLSIMNGFQLFSCTNIPREISRSIEKEFGVEVSRDRVDFISKYKQPGFYFRYRLNKTEGNLPGIAKMKEYIQSQLSTEPPAKTVKEQKRQSQTQLFINTL